MRTKWRRWRVRKTRKSKGRMSEDEGSGYVRRAGHANHGIRSV